ncbi:proteasomal ubiquitin receptor ADRM1-B [Patella vulgata]|uniref:proteasomal ubiquitin receptor ADRM1-B n=1 Tax=Patella vulgata TaxID=6465 RepID=UPI0021807880|nr:proteasomal ubiquitin receptor ADRM1-B [Patella vulgata]
MASGALFGNASGRSQSKNLVEFRAGKMTLRDKTVTADKRKGLVYVYQSDDSLMHFCWKDRTTGTLEDDLIIFPDDIEFKHLAQCTTGRAYLLKFKNSSRKYFYWLQEPKTEKDEDNCRKVNDFLNHPPAPGSNRSAGGSGGLPSDLSGLGDSELQNVLSGMSQQQLMQLLGGGLGLGGGGSGGLSSLLGRPSSSQSTTSEPGVRLSSSRSSTTAGETTPTTTRPATAAALPSPATTSADNNSSARQQIQLSDLQNILSSINVPPTEERDRVDLSQALNPESMIPILANPDIQRQLVPYLPEGETLPKTEGELRNTISSPQFQQALSSFSSALQSGDLGPLMTQFGLGEDVANAAAQGDMEAFVKAMQEGMKKEDDKKDDKGDEKMEH